MNTEGKAPAVDLEVVEELERLAGLGWPALKSEPIGEWIAGASGSYTRRANCVATSRASQPVVDLVADVTSVEAHYAARGLPAVFKLTSASASGLDDLLASRGYSADGETLTMTLPLKSMPQASSRGDRVEVVAGRVPSAWLDASNRYSRVRASSRADYEALLDRCLATQRAVLFGHLLFDAICTQPANSAADIDHRFVYRIPKVVTGIPAHDESARLGHKGAHMPD